MTVTNSQYNLYPALTPCRLVAVGNQAGSYSNGPLNNGVGATLTYATGVLTIDSVDVNLNDRVLLAAQTAANQNGIYVCIQQGTVGVAAVLQRAADFQNIEQMFAGQYVSIAAGTANGGNIWTLVELLPAHLGIDDMTFVQV